MAWRVGVLEPGPSIACDGVRFPLSWELLDGAAVGIADEARVMVSAAGDVEALAPRRTVAEALTLLREAGVVDIDHGGDDTDPWPLVVLGLAFDAGGPGVFAHDHEYLDLEAARRWAALSLTPGLEVRDGDGGDEPELVVSAAGVDMRARRAVGQELVASLNAALAHLDAGLRWYTLPSLDERAVHLRLDRDTASRLGVGVFARPDR